MAKTRSDTSRYPSRYSPKIDQDGFAWVTGRQYIVELICENQAIKQKKELPRGFYTKSLDLPEWKRLYDQQITNRSLNKLILQHSVDKIIAFLKDHRYITSLRPKWVHNKLNEYKFVEKTTNSTQQNVPYNFNKKESFDSNNSKKSIVSKLEDLE